MIPMGSNVTYCSMSLSFATFHINLSLLTTPSHPVRRVHTVTFPFALSAVALSFPFPQLAGPPRSSSGRVSRPKPNAYTGSPWPLPKSIRFELSEETPAMESRQKDEGSGVVG